MMKRREFISKLAVSGLGSLWLSQLLPSRALEWFEEPRQSLLLTEAKELTLSPKYVVEQGISNEFPAVAVRNDTPFVAWSSTREGKEGIYLKSLVENQWKPELVLSKEMGIELDPVMVASAEQLYVVWAARRAEGWQIRLAAIDREGAAEEYRICEGGINWRPAATIDHQGDVWISWEHKGTGAFAIQARSFSRGKLTPIMTIPMVHDTDAQRPAVACDRDRNPWFAWDQYRGEGNTRIVVRALVRGKWTEEIEASQHRCLNLAPALAFDPEGRLWIAWHHNWHPQRGYDMAKWYQLACYHQGKFYQPVAQLPNKDMEKSGVDQGFEFTRLLVGADGRVIVSGRPSHNFCLQYYHGDQWSPLYRLPADGWGGRGKFLQLATDKNESLWVVRRDLQHCVLHKISPFKSEPQAPVLEERGSGQAMPAVLSRKPSPAPQFPPLNEKYQFFFGDLHYHSWHSDGMGEPEEFYLRTRDFYGDHFASLTDHDNFVGNRLAPSEWELIKEITEHFNASGRFVTFFGQEWTTARTPRGYGHKNVYTTDVRIPVFDHLEPEYKTTAQLLEAIKPYGAIAVPHHIGWTGIDWENLEPDTVPVVEIASAHGAFEYMGNRPIAHRGGLQGCFVQDGLKRGLKFGIIAGSDCHGLLWHHRVCWKRESARAGLTCLLAEELTREALFEALKRRRCYATTGTKLRLAFQLNEAIMGEELTVSEPPELSIDVFSPEVAIQWITLVRDCQDFYSYGGEGFRSRFRLTDKELTPGAHHYYVRVLLKDGNMAWSSPIWVTLT